MQREIFLKKINLSGCPYTAAESHRLRMTEYAVWLTDDRICLRRMLAEGKCVVYVLTPENREICCPEAEWCVELSDHDAVLPDWITMDFLWRVWLRKHDLPWQICETERLYLREMTEDDLDFLYHCHQDTQSARFVAGPTADREAELEKIGAYRKQVYGFFGFGLWIVCEKESGQPVGRAGLQLREEEEIPELGFEIEKSCRGVGYAREALKAVLAYAKEELEMAELRSVVDVENTASQKLCESLGFAEQKRQAMDGREWIFYHRYL